MSIVSHISLSNPDKQPNARMCKTDSGKDAYCVLGLCLSVQWLCEVQSSSVSVHGEEINRILISSWTSDAVIDLLYFIFIRTDLDKTHQARVIPQSLTTTIDIAKHCKIISTTVRTQCRGLRFMLYLNFQGIESEIVACL